ncbi:MAG: class I SAM-dependent methyltransferase [Candidatus Nanopelagicaceae bacterium]|nr:class I SAM-dependent methyltransferase [Candidatus Nanopelagicaceae bacterium]
MRTQLGVFESERGTKFCRGCSSTNLFQVIQLGDLPIANELPKDPDELIDLFPLDFSVCRDCGLGQIGEPISRERLFSDYRYLSSISATWLEHARKFAVRMTNELKLMKEDLVVEIASNDGYLLQYFADLGVKVIGVEPAENVAQRATNKGIETYVEFFGLDCSQKIKSQVGSPKLIVANNVVAHVPDIQDFFQGLSNLANEETLISIENPSILNLITGNQFDTIYHEHYSYLSAFAIRNLGEKFGLNLFGIEEISTHGGSNRYWMKRSVLSATERENVDKFIAHELEVGLINEAIWKSFASAVSESLGELRDWLAERQVNRNNVLGFTAAAKASTILNAAQIPGTAIMAITDSSPEKQGRYLPSLGLPIISLQDMSSMKPTDILIFAWNIAPEISQLIWRELGSNVRCWVAIPKLKELTHEL